MKPYELTEYETQACARYAWLKSEIKRLTEESETYKATIAGCVNLHGTVNTPHGRLAPTPSVSYPVPTAIQFHAAVLAPLEKRVLDCRDQLWTTLSDQGKASETLHSSLFPHPDLSDGFPFTSTELDDLTQESTDQVSVQAHALRDALRSFDSAQKHLEILEGLESTKAWEKDAIDLLKFEKVIKPETNHTVKFLPPLNALPKLPKVPTRKSKAALTEA